MPLRRKSTRRHSAPCRLRNFPYKTSNTVHIAVPKTVAFNIIFSLFPHKPAWHVYGSTPVGSPCFTYDLYVLVSTSAGPCCARACKSQSQPPSEARAFLRDAHTHHAQISSLGNTWIGGVALFGRTVLELREAQRPENEDVDTFGARMRRVQFAVVNPAPRNGARGTVDLHVHVGAALGLGETMRARWVKVLKEARALLNSPQTTFFSCHHEVIKSAVVNTMLGSERTLVGWVEFRS
jgi:hypothetical protein